MAINPIGAAGINQNMNIAPLSPQTPVSPAAKPGTSAPNAPQTPEIGRNLAPTDDKTKFGMIELKDSAAQLGMAAELADPSLVPHQFASLGADGKVEGVGDSPAANMKAIQDATAGKKPGELPSMFDKQSPAEAADPKGEPAGVAADTSLFPQQFASLGADGKVEGVGDSPAANMEAVQEATADKAPGGLASMFDKQSPAEAAANDNTPSFAIAGIPKANEI